MPVERRRSVLRDQQYPSGDRTSRMETVTVTVVDNPQSETEGTTRERKISRVRKISDIATNIVTLNHNHQGHQPLREDGVPAAQDAVRERKISREGPAAAAARERKISRESQWAPRERRMSRGMRKLSDAFTSVVAIGHYPQPGEEVRPELEEHNRERRMSRVRKISDQVTNLITGLHSYDYGSQHPHHHRSELIISEQIPDTVAERKESIESADLPHHHVPIEPDSRSIKSEGPTSDTALNESGDSKKWPQVLASLAANMGAFAFGAVLAWSATGIPSIVETGDLGEMSTGISSWIGSIPTLGAVAACPFAGFALDTLGRRRSMLYLTLPFILGWLLIGFAQNYWMVLAGRFVTGFCGGCFSIAAPIFTAETADANIRGGLGSLFDLLLSTGMLYIYVVGVFLPWRYQAIACAVIPVAFHVIMFFVPESPRYLIQKDKDHKAEKAIYWLRGSTIAQNVVEKEISDLKTSVEDTKGHGISVKAAADRSIVMPVSILMGIMLFTTLSGIDAVMAYTVSIFESAGSTMDPKISTIIIGVVTVLASIPTAAIVDLAGRRILLMASELVMTVAMAIMGLYFFMMRTGTVLFGAVHHTDVNWVPLAALVLFIIGYSLGCGPLSMMMIGELLPNRMKGLTSCIVLMTRWFLAFGVTNVFAPLKEAINDDGTYWLLSVICFTGSFFVFFCVPETKGKSLAEIQLYFTGHTQTNIQIATNANSNGKVDNRASVLGGLGAYDNKIDLEV